MIGDKTDMRSIGLLPFTGTNREPVPYKVTTVVHKFHFIRPPRFSCIHIELRDDETALQWLFGTSNIFTLRCSC